MFKLTSSTVTEMWRSRLRLPRPRVVAAIVRRDFADTRSYHLTLLLEVFFGVIDLAVYYFISQTFGDFTPGDLAGAPTYFAFAAVGAVIATVIHAATAGIGQRIRTEQVSGTLEALLTNPVTSIELCLGLTGFPFVFALARSIFYLVIAGAWMDLDLGDTSWVGLAAVFVASGFALSSLGILAGAVVLVLKRGYVLVDTLVFGLTLVSGAVFPVSVLPGWLEAFGEVSPLRLAFDGTRAALFEGSGWGSDAALLAAFGVVTLPLALLSFSLAASYAKRAGSIAQY
jgi:ABC-2 type transport system permease protein